MCLYVMLELPQLRNCRWCLPSDPDNLKHTIPVVLANLGTEAMRYHSIVTAQLFGQCANLAGMVAAIVEQLDRTDVSPLFNDHCVDFSGEHVLYVREVETQVDNPTEIHTSAGERERLDG